MYYDLILCLNDHKNKTNITKINLHTSEVVMGHFGHPQLKKDLQRGYISGFSSVKYAHSFCS